MNQLKKCLSSHKNVEAAGFLFFAFLPFDRIIQECIGKNFGENNLVNNDFIVFKLECIFGDWKHCLKSEKMTKMIGNCDRKLLS